MKISTFIVWMMSPILILGGLYFLRVRPMQEEVRQLSVAAEALDQSVTRVEAAVGIAGPDPSTLDYWDFLEEWSQSRRDLTGIRFEKWRELQEGLKITVAGTVDDVVSGYSGRCIVLLERPAPATRRMRHWKSNIAISAECAEVEDLNQGTPIRALCRVSATKYNLDDPDVEDCQVQGR
jgi:hypothetical protein